MNPPPRLLRALLLTCVVFFLCMALAHFFGLKLPLLFVYYDTAFYAYQDKIIAFTLVTYAALFFGATRHTAFVPYALISIWTTVIGLALVNFSSDLGEVLTARGATYYWAQTGMFGGLASVLTALWLRQRKERAA